MSDEERAAANRFMAACLRMHAARFDMMAEVCVATAAMRRLTAVMQSGYDNELATHPDLAELNIQLHARYDLPNA